MSHQFSLSASRASQLTRNLLAAVALLLTAALPFTAEAQNAQVRLETTPFAEPGETIIVDVFLDAPAGVSISGGEFAIEFDRTLFTLTDLTVPSDLPGAIAPDVFAFNAPAPVGVRGTNGCSSWWDGLGLEAISVSFVYAAGLVPAGEPFLQFALELSNVAPNGPVTLGEPAADFSCLWSGTFFVDAAAAVIPTSPPSATIEVTDVLEPTAFLCQGVGTTAVELSWANAGLYDNIEVYRDGVLIESRLAGTAESFLDDMVALGQTYEYTLIAQFDGTNAPPTTCTIVFDGSIPSPIDLACTESGGGVDLAWTLTGTYDEITVARDGSVIATLSGDATSYTDAAPPTNQLLEYEVNGVVGPDSSAPADCSIEVVLIENAFERGDANLDDAVNVADTITVLNYLFSGGDLTCFDAADSNDDGSLNLADGIFLIEFLFSMGPAIPPPTGAPGLDPTPDGLDCAL